MSRQLLFPREFATSQTSCQPLGRIPGSCHTVLNSCAKFSHVMWCKISGVFTNLGPNKLNRIEFRSTSRKMIDMQARILGNEILNELAFMDGMVIPDQNDLARNNPQQLLQESHNLFAAQAVPVRVRGQLDLAAIQIDQQCTQQVQPLMMRKAGTNGGRMPTWRPTPFERRDQREAAFHLQAPAWPATHATFFILGQARRFQETMASSSRWIARRCTFWLLQPIRSIMCQTPLGT
jgi:hypothetical protein